MNVWNLSWHCWFLSQSLTLITKKEPKITDTRMQVKSHMTMVTPTVRFPLRQYLSSSFLLWRTTFSSMQWKSHTRVSQFQPVSLILYLHRSCTRPHDVGGFVGPRWDHRLPGCGEICASAEGRERPRTLPQPLAWYDGVNSPADII